MVLFMKSATWPFLPRLQTCPPCPNSSPSPSFSQSLSFLSYVPPKVFAGPFHCLPACLPADECGSPAVSAATASPLRSRSTIPWPSLSLIGAFVNLSGYECISLYYIPRLVCLDGKCMYSGKSIIWRPCSGQCHFIDVLRTLPSSTRTP